MNLEKEKILKRLKASKPEKRKRVYEADSCLRD